MQAKLKELDGWLRNRLRYCIWHHWNRACELTIEGRNIPERKRKNLIQLGIDYDHAYAWSRTRPERSEFMNTKINYRGE